MRKHLALSLFAVLLITPIVTQSAQATNWYPGQGLKQGDYFRYNVCWTDYHNCSSLKIDFWVKNQTSYGTGWNLEFLAIDGVIVQKGTVTIGMVTPDPMYSDPNVSDYANVYKNTIAWLDACATRDSPKDFNLPAWCRNGGVGGAPLVPEGQADVTVQAGLYKAWMIGWHKGVDNTIWVVPDLPFPVKAQVFADVIQPPAPPQYIFELLETGNSQTEPSFLNVPSTVNPGGNENCPAPDMGNDSVHKSQTTDSGSMIVEYRYSPSSPHLGCPMEWRISFEKNFDPAQKYSSVQYDIFTVDSSGQKIDSIAQDNGRQALFAPVGDDDRTIIVKGTTPQTHFVIAALGTGPDGTAPDTSLAGLIKIDVSAQPSVIPEFPLSVMLVMTMVITIGILFSRLRPGLSGIKF